MKSRCALFLLVSLLAVALPAQAAWADGDPGSDVLVYQRLFLAADAGISIQQQLTLDGLLRQAAGRGVPIRVAIISSPSDLGAITGLWLKPRPYARFLGLELSLAYKGRLLVVMPNGFGFTWPGHASTAAYRTLSRIGIRPRGGGLADAAQKAVVSLAATAGVKLGSPTRSSGAPQPTPTNQAPASSSGSSADLVAAIVAAALLGATALVLLARRLSHRKALRMPRLSRRTIALAGGIVVAAGAAIAVPVGIGPPTVAQSDALVKNPELDPGTPLSKPAPSFTLTDQFGQPVSLSSFHGKVVLLAFNDSECTTICPLTTTAMLDAKAMLGAAGDQVQLLGVDANPKATALEDVLSYSELHGMLHSWHFLTGSLPQLKRVWSAYGVQAAIQGGQISHTPALFVIGPDGRIGKLYMTQQSYAAIGQLGQLLAEEASALLPGHPAVHTQYSYSQIGGVSPATTATLPRAGGGKVRLGPGRPRLYLFFATWDQEITSLAGNLDRLNDYAAAARSGRLPALTAVDEASVEPSHATISHFLASLPRPLSYPVAIDASGKVGDGYEVEGLPWLMAVSASGKFAWYYSVGVLGWPSTRTLVATVREALSRVAGRPVNTASALAGSPPTLAALHQQADRLLGSSPQLLARVHALRGYPIVINAWASWCGPCRSEFGLLANASARYGREVAFLGADTDDSAGDAQAFLAQHRVSYPSYETSTSDMSAIAPGGLQGLPTTIFINRTGKVVFVHTGQYDTQGALDGDIESYVFGG